MFGADRIDQDTEGSDGELISVDSSQGVADGGDQIRATADGFCDEGVGSGGGVQFSGGVDEGIEAAAKTTTRDFLGSEAAGAEHGGIDEFAALIIGDETDLEPGLGEMVGESGDGGRLPGTEESTDHEIACGVAHGTMVAGVRVPIVPVAVVSPTCGR